MFYYSIASFSMLFLYYNNTEIFFSQKLAFIIYYLIMINLDAHIIDLNEVIKRLESSLVSTPNGNITCRKINNKFYFFRIQKGLPDEPLGKNKEPLIRALAQKRYNKELLDALIWEKNTLVRTTNNLNSNRRHKTAAQVWADFPEPLKPYVVQEPGFDEREIQKFINDTDDEFNYRKVVNNNDTFYTLRGEHVRSKSEILIADRLYYEGIPYHYEKTLYLAHPDKDCIPILPDFTILNKRTLQTWYWEHFGRLHDEKYREEAKLKFDTYGYNNIVPGKNLIITMETAQNQLSTRYIEQLINLYLK